MDDFFTPAAGESSPVIESFDTHRLTLSLDAGPGMMNPTVKVECLVPESDKTVCTPEFCQLKDTYDMVGWEAFRPVDNIELSTLKARMDWSDADEPWIDLEAD